MDRKLTSQDVTNLLKNEEFITRMKDLWVKVQESMLTGEPVEVGSLMPCLLCGEEPRQLDLSVDGDGPMMEWWPCRHRFRPNQ